MLFSLFVAPHYAAKLVGLHSLYLKRAENTHGCCVAKRIELRNCSHPNFHFKTKFALLNSHERRATRDRNTTTYENNYKAMNLIKINLFVHTFIMNTITEST